MASSIKSQLSSGWLLLSLPSSSELDAESISSEIVVLPTVLAAMEPGSSDRCLDSSFCSDSDAMRGDSRKSTWRPGTFGFGFDAAESILFRFFLYWNISKSREDGATSVIKLYSSPISTICECTLLYSPGVLRRSLGSLFGLELKVTFWLALPEGKILGDEG
jgi:hypothetical protein